MRAPTAVKALTTQNKTQSLYGAYIFVLSTFFGILSDEASVKAPHGLKSRRLVDGRDSVIC